MEKRGQVGEKIAGAVLLIAGFMVILFAMGSLFLDRELTEGQVCKTSVLARDAANIKPEVFQGSKYLPLNCQTTKNCLGEGKCDVDFVDTESSPVNKIEFESDDSVEIQKEILDVYSEAILNCHVKMGEGYANFLPANFGETSYCIVCSRISIDESLKDSAPEKISRFNVFENMEKKSFERENYLERVYGVESANQISADYNLAKEVNVKKVEGVDDLGKLREDLNNFDLNFDPREEQAVIVNVVKKGTWLSAIGGGSVASAAVAGGAYLSLTGAGAIIGIPVAGVGVALGGLTYVSTNFNEKYSYHAPTLTKYDAENLKKIGCDSYENLP
tara:strand:+ start:1538 stop:2530 length:993 start_codon:yes stop_codon:yes gene_type:complete